MLNLLALISILLTMCHAHKAFAGALQSVRVREVSSSKRSVVLPLGTIDGTKIGSRGKLYIKQGSASSPKYIYVAKAEAIKVHSDYSYWFLRQIAGGQHIVKDAILVLGSIARESKQLPSILRKKVVVPPGMLAKDYQKNFDDNLPKTLVKGDAGYFSEADGLSKSTVKRHELESSYVSEWQSMDNIYSENYDQELLALESDIEDEADVEKEILSKKEEVVQKEMESLLDGSIKKINEADYNFTSLSRELGEEDKVSKDAISKVNRGGYRWSSDMSDGELRDFFIKSGITEEVQRRYRAFNQTTKGQEVNFVYTLGLDKNTTAEDTAYRGASAYAISVGYELHLGRTSQWLNKFTVSLALSNGISYINMGGINGRLAEMAFNGHIHWYFRKPPFRIRRYLPFVGVGLSRGRAIATSPGLDGRGVALQSSSLPSWRLGLKYLFRDKDTNDDVLKMGKSVNVVLSGGVKKYANSDWDSASVPVGFSANNTSLELGFGVYF